jgi:hypothetical protein
VLLALIGRNWLSATNSAGQRRLDDPNDFVRLETVAALRRDIPVIPVLLQGARMPRDDELPADLHDLAFRNGVEITHARWDSDVQLLVDALRPYVEQAASGEGGADAPPPAIPPAAAAPPVSLAAPAPAPPQASAAPATGRKWLIPAVMAAVAAVGVGAWTSFGGRSGGDAAPPAAVAQRPTEATLPAGEAPSAADDGAARAAVEKLAAEKAAAQRLATQKAAAAKAAADKLTADKAAADQVAAARRAAQVGAHRDGVCLSGFVWRDARPGDKVCVTPVMRAQVAGENGGAASRRQPGGGAYGPNTCRAGLVWREAYVGDVVCVTPVSRQQAAADNAAAASRVVPLPP